METGACFSESPQPTPQSYKDRKCPASGCFREQNYANIQGYENI